MDSPVSNLHRIYHTRYTPPAQNISHPLHTTCTEYTTKFHPHSTHITPITQHLHRISHTNYTTPPQSIPHTLHPHHTYCTTHAQSIPPSACHTCHTTPAQLISHPLHNTCTKCITSITQHQQQSISHPSYHTTPAHII